MKSNGKVGGVVVILLLSVNLSTVNQEFPVTTNPEDQLWPAISKDIVVWRDYRNGDWNIYGCNISEILKIEPPSTPQSPLSQIYDTLKRVTFTPSELLYIFLGAIAIVKILILRLKEGKKEIFPMRR